MLFGAIIICIYINGAEPGNVLEVNILFIETAIPVCL